MRRIEFIIGVIAIMAAANISSDAAVKKREKASESDTSDSSAPPTDRLPRTRVVRTKYGQVQGRMHSLKSAMLKEMGLKLADVEVFQGIRYATPPVGNNRQVN